MTPDTTDVRLPYPLLVEALGTQALEILILQAQRRALQHQLTVIQARASTNGTHITQESTPAGVPD
jgi:hypothetical protein